ncbi:MAG TPA: class I SAM-dependent methyltransferase [Vicinamibacterales bacterium]|jgi:2-polyprenyl-3-methyl-5-hydroxy-6-metoxy-1,4-benzoquinol methylase|nr:class I SAM-dependent methyltransferase [Vicinamibacterales bacterium]
MGLASVASARVEAVGFAPVKACWVCDGQSLAPVHECQFDLSVYESQDPGLAAYSGSRLWIVRCASCGFGQPSALPALPRFFERMYDQRWSGEWLESEFASGAKRFIFEGILDDLERRLPDERRMLLDVGTHVGQFVAMAGARGWRAEGLELNPRTAAHARRSTGAPVHQINVHELGAAGRRFDAVAITDVLEHIPQPRATLEAIAQLLSPGGWIAVKVPNGPNQLRKEQVRAALGRASRVSVADNLVHVNHFSFEALSTALARAGFRDIEVRVGRPELTPSRLSSVARQAVFHAARWSGGGRSPLAFNLQAFARS